MRLFSYWERTPGHVLITQHLIIPIIGVNTVCVDVKLTRCHLAGEWWDRDLVRQMPKHVFLCVCSTAIPRLYSHADPGQIQLEKQITMDKAGEQRTKLATDPPWAPSSVLAWFVLGYGSVYTSVLSEMRLTMASLLTKQYYWGDHLGQLM